MKNLFTLTLLVLTISVVQAQDTEDEILVSKAAQLFSNLTFTTSAGAPSFQSISLGELNISYKINPHFSAGFSVMGSLGDCLEGYNNAEGQFMSGDLDDDELEDGMGDDLDNDMMELEDENESCDDDAFENLMGTVTFKFSDQLPLFFQVSGGYSLSNNRPAYSAAIGYTQKIISKLGLVVDLRYSDILHKMPTDAVKVISSSGFKAEVGLNWNF